jgi:predicted transcriptional regulator
VSLLEQAISEANLTSYQHVSGCLGLTGSPIDILSFFALLTVADPVLAQDLADRMKRTGDTYYFPS